MSVDQQQVSPTHAAFRAVFGEATDLVERLLDENKDRAVGLATVLALLHAEAFEWGTPSDDGFAQLIRDVREAMQQAVRP